jgi:hypothetical protein
VPPPLASCHRGLALPRQLLIELEHHLVEDAAVVTEVEHRHGCLVLLGAALAAPL